MEHLLVHTGAGLYRVLHAAYGRRVGAGRSRICVAIRRHLIRRQVRPGRRQVQGYRRWFACVSHRRVCGWVVPDGGGKVRKIRYATQELSDGLLNVNVFLP